VCQPGLGLGLESMRGRQGWVREGGGACVAGRLAIMQFGEVCSVWWRAGWHVGEVKRGLTMPGQGGRTGRGSEVVYVWVRCVV
jgi:hypothetical protein